MNESKTHGLTRRIHGLHADHLRFGDRMVLSSFLLLQDGQLNERRTYRAAWRRQDRRTGEKDWETYDRAREAADALSEPLTGSGGVSRQPEQQITGGRSDRQQNESIQGMAGAKWMTTRK